MSDSEYMPLGRSGGPYRAPGTPPARAVALLGVGMLCGYFLLDLVQPQSSSRRVAAAASDALVTVVARDEGAEQRMRAAAAVARQAEPAAGQGESESTLLDPKALRELRQALKAAVAEAHASGPGTDPLALLAHRLLQRPAADRPTTAAAPAATNVAAGGGGGGGGGGASLPPNGGLPSKLPTAAMWPPRFTRGGGVRSGFESLGRLEPYRGGDLEQPGELARAAKARSCSCDPHPAARSFNGELVLTYGNEAGTAWIANFVFSLRAVGIEHFLVIVMYDEHCAELMKPPWRISCAWSSWDFGKSRESGRGCRRPGELRRLWYSRHHYMSRVIGELNLNVAVVDGDISVQRDFYPLLKAPPLREHNLIYTLDHQHTCGDLNVGFAYCQNCASGGRAQWAIDEGLRREGYFCAGEPGEFDGAKARFWARSDGAGVTAGPHRWVEWTTARDQKLYSDVVGGSCCGAPQHRLLFPGTYKQVGDSYAFMRQWGSHAGCMTMAAAGGGASGLQTWWHELLMGGNASDGYARAGGPRETVAIATGSLASGWHGTGEGELAGWSGHWSERPPAVAHFVGGGPAGGKVEIMQGLGWWRYEADVAAHAIAEATNKTAGYALPRSFFWPATRRGVRVLAGAPARGATRPTE